jgi:hypothetical protein
MARPIAALRGVITGATLIVCLLVSLAVVAVDPWSPAAHGTPGCAKCGGDPEPPPPPPDPEPRSEGDAFVGQAALFNHDGQVVDSGGSACPGCEWRLQKACELGGNVLCHELMRCGENDDGSPRWVHDVFLLRPGGGGWN